MAGGGLVDGAMRSDRSRTDSRDDRYEQLALPTRRNPFSTVGRPIHDIVRATIPHAVKALNTQYRTLHILFLLQISFVLDYFIRNQHANTVDWCTPRCIMADDTTDTDRTASSEKSIPASDGRGFSRRSVLGSVTGLTAVGVGSTAVSAQSDSGVSTPDIEGPIEGGSRTGKPQGAAVFDVSSYGYSEAEYFISGDAVHEDDISGYGWFTDEASYRTRMVVYRPDDPAEFNGTVLVEWLNVSTQVDAPVTWVNAYDHLLRNGYAVALVSAQKVGVDDSSEDMDLVTWDPERYGDLTHPGDEYALDIFSQAIQALRTGGEDSSDDSYWWSDGSDGSDSGTDPLEGLTVDTVLATGQSQSAFYMRNYITDVQPEYGIVDGFLPACSGLTDVPDDLAPVLWLNSEDEATSDLDFGFGGDGPRDDSNLFKLWEVAGASHVNYWLHAWNDAVAARDHDAEPATWDETTAGQYGQQADGTFGECGYNYFPMRDAYRAAVEHLRAWVEDGAEPPSAPRLERADGEVRTDESGNALGGLRLPPIDVPVATYDARNSDCDLTGQTHPFDDATLADLYPTHDDYVAEFQAAADAAVDRGHLLSTDAEALVQRAEASSIGE